MSDVLSVADLTVRPRLADVLGGIAHGARRRRMETSRQWAGAGFKNVAQKTVPPPTRLLHAGLDLWKHRATQRPPAPLPMLSDSVVRLAQAPSSSLRMTWLGHSTVLLELDGLRFLTDPVFGARASPLPAVGPLRFHAPPIAVSELPRIDAVLVSHDHYDHLDYSTIRAMAADRRFDDTRFICALGVGAHLEAWGIAAARIEELDWWEDTRVGTVKITAGPAQHFSGRGAGDRDNTLWASFMVQGSASVFFSGDTGLSPHFAEIRRTLGAPDVAMLEVGAWNEAWGDIHLGPDNAREAFKDLGAAVFMPVHWATFALGAHPWDEPGEQLYVAGSKQGLPLLTPLLGEPFEPSRQPATGPWWRDVKKSRR